MEKLASLRESSSTVIVQLGGPNDAMGNLSSIVSARCEKTLEIANYLPYAKILCTGGKAKHFNESVFLHFELIQAHLEAKGIKAERLLAGVASRFTKEDALLARQALLPYDVDTLVLVTSEFHAPRALMIFKHYFSNTKIVSVPAANGIEGEELESLLRHEQVAIVRDKNNLMN